MGTITEDYVSFEIAKLLKKKGFDERCTHYYKNEKYLVDLGYTNIHSYTNSDLVEEFAAPTLQMAMKWLREKKNIFIDVYYEEDIKGYMYSIIKLTKGTILNVSDLADNSYEESCEASIKYCLENLI